MNYKSLESGPFPMKGQITNQKLEKNNDPDRPWLVTETKEFYLTTTEKEAFIQREKKYKASLQNPQTPSKEQLDEIQDHIDDLEAVV